MMKTKCSLCKICITKNSLSKQNAAKNLGYNYEIWVYNRKGQILDIQK